MVVDHYLIVQRWRSFFLINVESMKKVAVWIRIQRLSIELYNNTLLKRVGMSMGKFMQVDSLMSIHS